MRMKKGIKKMAAIIIGTLLAVQVPAPYLLAQGMISGEQGMNDVTIQSNSLEANHNDLDGIELADPTEPGDEDEAVSIESISLNVSKATLAKKATIKLIATVLPENAEDSSVLWESSDEDVVTVTDEGVVTAVEAGTAVITASAADGSDVSADCTITVSNAKSYQIKYVLGGGKNATTNPDFYAAGSKVTLDNPTKKNFIFSGWYRDDEKIKYISKTMTGNITLTARWEKITLEKTVIKEAKNKKEGRITIKFEKVSGAKGYTVYYATDKRLTNANTIDIKSSQRSTDITGLVKGTTYFVAVKAYRIDSEGNRTYGKSEIKKVKINK
jgi:uncharacterized repeat protein (TIGR02543 family)